MKAQEIILEPIMTEKSYVGIPNKVTHSKLQQLQIKLKSKKQLKNCLKFKLQELTQ